MKIAMGIFRWFPYGGLQKDFLRMAKLLAARGHVVCAYCGNGSEDIPADAPGIRWTRLATPGMTNHTRATAFESRFAAACRREPRQWPRSPSRLSRARSPLMRCPL